MRRTQFLGVKLGVGNRKGALSFRKGRKGFQYIIKEKYKAAQRNKINKPFTQLLWALCTVGIVTNNGLM
jgi:hypothetical protein